MDSKSEINNEAEKTCATGKFAALYGVSVRTVQYYDEKDLLPPSGLTEGGRRIYTEADAAWRQQVAREAPYSRLCPPERPCHRHQRCSASRRPSENELSRCRPLGGQYLPHLAQQTYNAGRSRGRDRSCLQPFRPCRATLYTSTNGGFPEASASMISTRGAAAFAAGAGASAPSTSESPAEETPTSPLANMGVPASPYVEESS